MEKLPQNFSGKFEKIRAEILRTPNYLHLQIFKPKLGGVQIQKKEKF